MVKLRKVLGLVVLLASLIVLTCLWERHAHGAIRFLTPQNLRNLLPWIGLFGILSLGEALVIITGGIDLSVGSVVALVGIICAVLLRDFGWPVAAAIPASLGVAIAVGAWHGLLVTKARMQPFVVTLCGLFFYRGIARLITGDTTRGFGTAFPNLTWLGSGFIPDDGSSLVSVPFVILMMLAVLEGAYLHFSAQGRHLFALGANEDAARFSGIPITRLKITAYALCGLLSGFGGLLIAFNVNSLGPTDFGSFYELYAIAGAVLGGCSLRGGSGNVAGVVVGASLIVVLKNLVNILEIPSQLEYVVIGGAILAGVFADEMFSRRQAGIRTAA
ncbi:MAG TPA: ABC transporter permease [Candidatus Hydrogenedentes bacterium]|nr:ABC transporter permease [Candidatus Hydrogenedentota bacterium]HOV73734.1 ABC transporter permease [Candidatus Hydrogenedentota bacterium]HPC17085.1 ABC transporter permease [Candidatus Hydrogenedentota bacterium]HRT20532.1 ABC transporter permease [Candidatus Hydrogenedentota bacterium]HRT65263.1 ABC transporter permease [Candidatus Hydrogenedentota bacterium]